MSDITYLLGFTLICLAIAAVIEAAAIEDKQIKDMKLQDNVDVGDVMSDDDWATFTEEN